MQYTLEVKLKSSLKSHEKQTLKISHSSRLYGTVTSNDFLLSSQPKTLARYTMSSSNQTSLKQRCIILSCTQVWRVYFSLLFFSTIILFQAFSSLRFIPFLAFQIPELKYVDCSIYPADSLASGSSAEYIYLFLLNP